MSQCPKCKTNVPFLKRFLNDYVCPGCKAKLVPAKSFTKELVTFNILLIVFFFLAFNVFRVSVGLLLSLYILVILPAYIFWFAFKMRYVVYAGEDEKLVSPSLINEVTEARDHLQAFLRINFYILFFYYSFVLGAALIFRSAASAYFVVSFVFGLMAVLHSFILLKFKAILNKIIDRHPLVFADEYFLKVYEQIFKLLSYLFTVLLIVFVGVLFLAFMFSGKLYSLAKSVEIFNIAILGIVGGGILIKYLRIENEVVKTIEQIRR